MLRFMSRKWSSSLMIAAAVLLPVTTRDVSGGQRVSIELKNGGRIEGELLDEQGESAAEYVVATANGGRVTIRRSEVARIGTLSEAEIEYRRRAHAATDTVESHWAMAQWCRSHRLRDESRKHLERIVQLDPHHAEARRLLGYRKSRGQWMTRDDVMAARGMVLYNGQYYTRQHIELLKRREEAREANADWSNRLQRWRRWLTGRRAERAEEARREILAIDDPAAGEPLAEMLEREEHPGIRRLLIEAAAQLDHPATVDLLVRISLYDPVEETRHRCLEHLIRSHRATLIGPYIRALRSADNVIVNRAAIALQEIGDPDAISPLIDALVTKHKTIQRSGSGDQHAYTFTPESSSFSFGGGGPKVVSHEVPNPAVRSALVALSGGVSFDYDEAQWRTWLAAQAKRHRVDVRRDE